MQTAISMTEKQFNRLIQSNWDFQQALSAITFLLEECEYEGTSTRAEMRKFRCYETTLVVSTMRPFDKSKNGLMQILGSMNYQLNEREQALLDKLRYTRDKIMAHSDDIEMHFKTKNLIIGKDEAEPTFPLIVYDEGLFFERSEILDLQNLIYKLMGNVTSTIFKYSQTHPEQFEKYKKPASMSNQEEIKKN